MQIYIEQIKIATRFKAHFTHYHYGRLESSSVAQHVNKTGRRISIENFQLVQNVFIDSLKEIHIHPILL